MFKEVLKRIIVEFWNTKQRYVLRENIELLRNSKKKQVIIVGPRRAGKSFSLFQIRDYIVKDVSKILYVNFEDFRLVNFKQENFNEILEAYYELQPEKNRFYS